MNDQNPELLALPVLLLSATRALVDAIQAGVEERGFTGLRPAHGFAFARLAPHGASIAELAEHLDITKQAASQLVDELLRRGYVAVGPHPRDARAKLVTLTDLGWACTRAADAAAHAAVQGWVDELGADRAGELVADLARMASTGKLRPSW